MAITIYNPKFLTVGGKKVVNTEDVKNFIWSHAKWNLEAGKMMKFPDDVAEAMLKHIGFLVRVTKENQTTIKAEVEEKKFKCEKCDFETNTKIAFMSHYKTHEKSTDVDDLDVEEAKPIGEYRANTPVIQNPEGDIPKGGTKYNPITDKDGVGWYGEGVERDTL